MPVRPRWQKTPGPLRCERSGSAPRSRIPPRTWANSARGMSRGPRSSDCSAPRSGVRNRRRWWPGPPFRGDEQRWNRRRTRAGSRHPGEIARRSAGPGRGRRHPVVIAPIRPVVAARDITGVLRTPRRWRPPSPSVKKMASDVKTAPLTLADAGCGKGNRPSNASTDEPREVQRS
jgi:hypothetical protein